MQDEVDPSNVGSNDMTRYDWRMWVTIEEIMAGCKLARGTIYKLASQHDWRRTRTCPRGYHIEDVMKTLGERSSAT